MKRKVSIVAVIGVCLLLFGACDEQGVDFITTTEPTVTTTIEQDVMSTDESVLAKSTTDAQSASVSAFATRNPSVTKTTTTAEPTTTAELTTTAKPTATASTAATKPVLGFVSVGSPLPLVLCEELNMKLDKTVYPIDDTLKATVKNTTKQPLGLHRHRYYVVEQNEDSGEWTTVNHGYLFPGSSSVNPRKEYTLSVDLAKFPLAPNRRYMFVMEVRYVNEGDKSVAVEWIGMEFETVKGTKPPTTTASRYTGTIYIPTWRTTARTRPGYTYPTIPAVFNEEELRTDVKLELDKTGYYSDENMDIRIKNTTDREICIDPARAVLKKNKSGEWEYVYQKVNEVSPRYLEVGMSYSYEYHIFDPRWGYGVADVALGAGEYKLIWAVDGGWIGADFTIVPKPTLFSESNMRPDVNLEVDKSVYRAGEMKDIRIKNTTDHDIVVHDMYNLLQKWKDGTWKNLTNPPPGEYKPTVLKPGEEYTRTLDLSFKIDTYVQMHGTAEYKLTWLVDDQWVVADFTVLAEPPTFVEWDVLEDVTLELDSTNHHKGEERHIRIQNTTDRDILVNDIYTFLERRNDGEWEILRRVEEEGARLLKPGEVYEQTLKFHYMDENSALSQWRDYGIAWAVDNKWVLAEFDLVK